MTPRSHPRTSWLIRIPAVENVVSTESNDFVTRERTDPSNDKLRLCRCSWNCNRGKVDWQRLGNVGRDRGLKRNDRKIHALVPTICSQDTAVGQPGWMHHRRSLDRYRCPERGWVGSEGNGSSSKRSRNLWRGYIFTKTMRGSEQLSWGHKNSATITPVGSRKGNVRVGCYQSGRKDSRALSGCIHDGIWTNELLAGVTNAPPFSLSEGWVSGPASEQAQTATRTTDARKQVPESLVFMVFSSTKDALAPVQARQVPFSRTSSTS